MLLKAPGGSKHVANLQGIWGCYQDARRNTEAMAFRGHRLLDQVRSRQQQGCRALPGVQRMPLLLPLLAVLFT